MTLTTLIRGSLVAAAIVSTAAAGQLPKARPTLTTEIGPGTGGASARLSLRVRLPENVHVQSDRPRDPSLIATALTLSPPPGVTVTRVTYPAASDLVQPGRPEPLAVFSGEFVIAIDVTMTGSAPVTVPGQLRYQACTDRVCFAPAKTPVEWEVSLR